MTNDERRLVEELRAGRPLALLELTVRYRRRLFDAVIQDFDSSRDAEVVVQETFRRAPASLADLKTDSSLLTWLHLIAINITHARKYPKESGLEVATGYATPPDSDDWRLIRECLEGKHQAFGLLVQRYQNRLFSSLRRLVDSEDEAFDLVQESFINAYTSLDSFKGDSQFFTWLYRIAVKTVTDRKQKKTGQ